MSTQQWAVACNRLHLANVAQSSGSLRNVAWRVSFWTRRDADVVGLRLVWSNNFLNTTGEVNGLNTILVTAAVEYNSAYVPVYFDGQRTVTIPVGGQAISDTVSISIPRNTQFFVRQNSQTLNATEKYATGYTARTDWGEGFSSTTPAAQVDGTGLLTGNTASAMFTPCSIIGLFNSNVVLPSVAIIGSSSAFGSNETFATLPMPGDRGYLSRMVTNHAGQCVIATGSHTLAQWITSSTRRQAILKAGGFTHAILQLGQNDITGSASAATMVTRLQSVWNDLNNNGLKVIQTTYTPVTTSTDSWATEENQTVTATEAVRVATNNYIRGLPSPLYGVIEAADAAESARDSGLWKVTGGAYTDDGTHSTRHADIATTILASDPSLGGIISSKSSTPHYIGTAKWAIFNDWDQGRRARYLKSFQRLGGIVQSAPSNANLVTSEGESKVDAAATRYGNRGP